MKTIILFIILISAFLFAYEETQEWLGTKWGDIREHIASIFHRASLIVLGYLCYTDVTLIQLPLLV